MLNVFLGGGLSLIYTKLNKKIKYEHDYNKLFVILSVLVSFLVSLRFENGLKRVVLAFLFTTLLNITFIDIKTMEIPDTYNLIVLILGVINILGVQSNYKLAIIGLLSFALFFVIAIFSGGSMGMGDVKLSLGLGLFYGANTYGRFLIATFGIGAGVALLLILSKKKTREDKIPFGPFIAIGSIISILL